jgi:hypothetical protein
MKLLFYADFLHFKLNEVSITGARYAHAPHGPVPDQFETWLTALVDWKKKLFTLNNLSGITWARSISAASRTGLSFQPRN